MANKFGTDILIQAQDPKLAASFYVQQLGFEITGRTARHDQPSRQAHQLIHRTRPGAGAVLEVTVGATSKKPSCAS